MQVASEWIRRPLLYLIRKYKEIVMKNKKLSFRSLTLGLCALALAPQIAVAQVGIGKARVNESLQVGCQNGTETQTITLRSTGYNGNGFLFAEPDLGAEDEVIGFSGIVTEKWRHDLGGFITASYPIGSRCNNISTYYDKVDNGEDDIAVTCPGLSGVVAAILQLTINRCK
jgi:hypothetical protein